MAGETIVLIFKDNPPGCENSHSDYYKGFWSWSLHKNGEFLCAGRRFATQQEAFDEAEEVLRNDFKHLKNNISINNTQTQN